MEKCLKGFFPKVLFELSAHISTPYIAPNFKEYVQKVEHRVLSEIPEARLKELKKEWEYYKAGGTYADDFQQVYGYFDDINNRFSDKLKQFDLKFLKVLRIYSRILEIYSQEQKQN